MFRRLLMLVVLAFAFQSALPGIAEARRPAGQKVSHHAPAKKTVKNNRKRGKKDRKHSRPAHSHGRRTHHR